MICTRCSGRLFLDEVFSDNTSYEVACLHCGDRKFVSKNTEFGQWLGKRVQEIRRAVDGLS
jgi:DNA-directed RNA polymerase subunit RPC12/RpoP